MKKILPLITLIAMVACGVQPTNKSQAASSDKSQTSPTSWFATGYQSHPKAKRFINKMVHNHNFSHSSLTNLFSKAKRRTDIINKYRKPKKNIAEHKKTYAWYRGIFMTDENIANGKAFMRNQSHALKRAEKKYGVPKEYIAAIIGVETKYGKHFGDDRVIDALTSLAFGYPKRERFFTAELKHFLLMTRAQGISPRKPKGSYAGAMGYGQFMPSSYRSYAVDFDGNGKKDLWNKTDAIGSIGNYFKRKGWRHNENAMTHSGKQLYNFKIIKRYNNSNRYAKVVHALAQAIK